MMSGNSFASRNIVQERKFLFLFMCAWFAVNCLQAQLIGLDGDEAYYWVLSQSPSWGYFDHPPLAPLLINIGESIAHGPLFTRLSTIILSTLTIPFLFGALPNHLKNIRWFIIVYAATLVFHVYGFITTPDAPLLFFSAVFFYGYKRFLSRQNFFNTLMMALAVTGMFYSKYHGVLPVLFVLISNPRLLLSKYAWLMVVVVSVLFLPHLFWQYNNDWPTLRYHLVERLSKEYEVSFTTNYFLGQLLIWGPFISLLFFYNIWRVRIKGDLMRAYLFSFAGVLLFFLFSSTKNSVEPHWTLIAAVSYVVLSLEIISKASDKFKKWYLRIACINIAIIILARILFLLPYSPFHLIAHYKSFFWGKEWAQQVNAKAQGRPVIFANAYTFPALYQFYNPQAESYGYNTKQYRKTNYSLGNTDCAYDGRPAVIFSQNAFTGGDTSVYILSKYKSGYMMPVVSYKCINSLKIKAVNLPPHFTPGETKPVVIELKNTGDHTISSAGLSIDYAFFKAKYSFENSTQSYKLPDAEMPPGYSKKIKINIAAPISTDDYRVLFSIVNGILPGNFASDYYNVKVD